MNIELYGMRNWVCTNKVIKQVDREYFWEGFVDESMAVTDDDHEVMRYKPLTAYYFR